MQSRLPSRCRGKVNRSNSFAPSSGFVIPSEAEEPAVALSIIVGDRDSPGLKAFEAKLNPATIPNEFVIPSEAEEPAVVLSMIDR